MSFVGSKPNFVSTISCSGKQSSIAAVVLVMPCSS